MMRQGCTILAAVLVALVAVAAPGRAGGLAGAYTDPGYLTRIPFGTHSHYLQPWRAYLETVPAARFVDGIGIGLNLDKESPDLVLRMLARNGIRAGRIEIGWGSLDWEDETRFAGDMSRARALLRACRKWGIRPLMLLNAHQGAPCPVRFFERVVAADAPAGATQVQLDDVSGLVPGRSGLSNLSDYWAAEALVTRVEGKNVSLSKPLPKAINAGSRVPMATLKYRPFSQPGSDDYRETMAGWQRYVAAVAAFATEELGTRGSADKGFDVEVWNEMSFGSSFLYVNAYYKPELVKYNGDSVWGGVVKGTTDHVEAHAADFAGVRIDDGFGNTLPWQASSTEPARIAAIGKHPYAGRKSFPKDEQRGAALNALGQPDAYCPAYTEAFPEYFGTAIQTETMVRELAPVVTDIYGTKHGRDARPGNPCSVWITEVGYAPNEDGVADRAEALALKAKTTARYLAFYLNKGVDRLAFYAATGGDLWLGLVQDNFLEYARAHTDYPADAAAYTSPALRVMARMAAKMKERMDPALVRTRSLRVEAITDIHDRYQFAGDGSPEHPPLYDREVFAFLPFQANGTRFAIPYYVMTRDVRKPLQPEEFTVTVSGIRGARASFTAYDPINDRPVRVKARVDGPDKVTLTLLAADYPYLLIVQEAPGGRTRPR